MTICPLASPHYLNILNQLMAIRSSCCFSHLRPGAFHIVSQTHKTQHTQPSGWKKRKTNKHGPELAPSARREKFVTLLFAFLVHVRSITSVYPSEIPSQPPGTLTHPLTLANPATGSTGPSFSLCSRLSLTLAFPRLLLTALGPCLPSSSSGLVVNLARKPFVLFSRQNRQRNLLTGTHSHTHTHTHRETNAQHRATIKYEKFHIILIREVPLV